MKMCEAMAGEGYEVGLLAPADLADRAPISGSVWRYYGVEPSFHITWLPARGPLANYLYGLLAALHCRLWRQPDIVFARHLPGALMAAALGCRVIFEAHDQPSGYGRLGPSLFSLLIRQRRLQRLVVVSQALKDQFLATWPSRLSPDALVVAPNGVDLTRFQNLPASSEARCQIGLLGQSSFVVGYSGHLYPGRGMEVVLELAARLPDVHFLLVGGDPEDVRAWKDRTSRAGLANVTLTGFVVNANLPLHLAACDVLLMPYQRQVLTAGGGADSSRWMSPLKAFEYLAAGRPILASDLPVLREILDEEVAHLLPPDDIDAWHMALERVRDDVALRQRLGDQARNRARRYSLSARVALCLGR